MPAMAVEGDGDTISRCGGDAMMSVFRSSSLPSFSSPKLVHCFGIQNPHTLKKEFSLNVSTKILVGNAIYDRGRNLGLIVVTQGKILKVYQIRGFCSCGWTRRERTKHKGGSVSFIIGGEKLVQVAFVAKVVAAAAKVAFDAAFQLMRLWF
ncbi:hypothetical protein NE237_024590 [Protea cynaroides]|uniref:Uncharacterized protein n=1 Tax=Protea cynaroides TaxID=273540 RepID=A0A9Q0H1H5_9MAGN|nr:hypothetical protein NE237_024590 [Protea cynaroides]